MGIRKLAVRDHQEQAGSPSGSSSLGPRREGPAHPGPRAPKEKAQLPRGAGRTRPGDAHSGLPRGSQPSRPRGLVGKRPVSPRGQPCPDAPERERAPGWTGGGCLGQSAQIRGQRGTRPSVPAGRLRPRCGEEASREGGGGPAEEGSDPCPGRCLPPAAPGIQAGPQARRRRLGRNRATPAPGRRRLPFQWVLGSRNGCRASAAPAQGALPAGAARDWPAPPRPGLGAQGPSPAAPP